MHIIHRIVVHIGHITATILYPIGIHSVCQRYWNAAVGNNRNRVIQRFRHTINSVIQIRFRRELVRSQGVCVSPNRVIACAVGIPEQEVHGSRSVGIDILCTTQGCHIQGIAACILHHRWGWRQHIGQALDFPYSICWETGETIRQCDVVGECPNGITATAIPIGVCISH